MGRSRSAAQTAICWRVRSERSSARSSSGAPTRSALSWLTAAAGPSGAQQHPQRLAVAALAGGCQLLGLLTEDVTGGSDGVDGVGLGAGAPWRSLGPGDLDQLLAVGAEEGGQARAVAAGALDGPAATAWQLGSGEVEQRLVADGIGTDRGLRQEAADRGEGGGGQGVAVGVDADDAIDELGQGGHVVDSLSGATAVSVSAREEAPRGRTVRSHDHCRSDRLLIKPTGGGPGRRRHHGRQLARRQPLVPVCLGVMPRCRRLSLTAILPDRRPTHSQFA